MAANFRFSVVLLIIVSLSVCYAANVRNWNLDSYQHHQQHREVTRSRSLYISLYEHENYRGKVYQQTISKDCTNLPRQVDNWASSVVFNDHCVTICENRDCKGRCAKFYPNDKGVKRLSQIGLNDKISSVKYCYQF